jgi:hypothetical protein
MKFLTLFLFLFSLDCQAFNKDFTLINDRSPLEFKMLFESMKYSLKDRNDQIKLVVLAQHINKGLAPLSKDQTFFLLKSEIYKALLEWPHSETQFQVGSHTLLRMKKNLNKGKAIYSPYSQWILEALIADLEGFEKKEVLDVSINQRGTLTGEKAKHYQKMQRVLKYTRGWIEQADTLSAKDFNHLSEELSWRTLERVKEKAALFRRFSTKAIQENLVNTFNIPDVGMPHTKEKSSLPVEPPKNTSTSDLSDVADEQKATAEETMQKINPQSTTPPPDELSDAIDQIEGEEIK